jgi:K+-sensing histidine kinase KdpD
MSPSTSAISFLALASASASRFDSFAASIINFLNFNSFSISPKKSVCISVLSSSVAAILRSACLIRSARSKNSF